MGSRVSPLEFPSLTTCVTGALLCPSWGLQIINPWSLLPGSVHSLARITSYAVGSNLQIWAEAELWGRMMGTIFSVIAAYLIIITKFISIYKWSGDSTFPAGTWTSWTLLHCRLWESWSCLLLQLPPIQISSWLPFVEIGGEYQILTGLSKGYNGSRTEMMVHLKARTGRCRGGWST